MTNEQPKFTTLTGLERKEIVAKLTSNPISPWVLAVARLHIEAGQKEKAK
jgi:hypothetical protein